MRVRICGFVFFCPNLLNITRRSQLFLFCARLGFGKDQKNILVNTCFFGGGGDGVGVGAGDGDGDGDSADDAQTFKRWRVVCNTWG